MQGREAPLAKQAVAWVEMRIRHFQSGSAIFTNNRSDCLPKNYLKPARKFLTGRLFERNVTTPDSPAKALDSLDGKPFMNKRQEA
jgi:hypothetical protein